MPDWFAIVLGVLLLGFVFADRASIREAWHSPSRWFTRDPEEYMRSRAPSQPFNVLLGVSLGVACIVYGVVALV